MPRGLRVIVTRPAHEAAAWVQRLRDAGFDAVALPLIEIAAAPDASALHDAWSRLGEFSAAMFVSGNAVRGFFAARPGGAVFTPRAWAPGPGTRDALLEAGVGAEAIDAPPPDARQFDSESLWSVVQPQLRAGQRVLLVRGGDANGEARGREWLAQQLAAAGVATEAVAAYVRRAPQWAAAQRDAALSPVSAAVWLFSSSEAIALLRELLPQADWRAARALATHPRIAGAARAAGFGAVVETRPAFDAVVAALESFA